MCERYVGLYVDLCAGGYAEITGVLCGYLRGYLCGYLCGDLCGDVCVRISY